jgi:hypothetical protein
MVEVVMYMAIGFLLGGLVALIAIPLVHNRAVRLTMRRVEASLPQTMAEIQADEDLLRAEFAMAMRRLELDLEKLRDRNARLLAQVSKKTDLANRLLAERDEMKAETLELRTQLATLERQGAVGAPRRRTPAQVERQTVPRRLVS